MDTKAFALFKSRLPLLLAILLPGVWMLSMSSIYMRWNHGGAILVGSLILFFISKTTVVPTNAQSPFPFVYISMLIWGIYQFANWIATDRAFHLAFLLLYESQLFRFLFNSALVLPMSYGFFLLIKYLLLLKSNRLWYYLIVHSLFLITTLWITHFRIPNEQCSSTFFTTMYMSCAVNKNLNFFLLILGAIVLLFLPTVLAIYYKQNGIQGYLIVLLSIAPLWVDVFFYPLQALGFPLTILGRQDASVFRSMSSIAQTSVWVTVSFFVIVAPFCFCLIKSEKILDFVLVFISIVVVAFVLMLHVRFLISLELLTLNIWYYLVWPGIVMLHVLIAIIVTVFVNFQMEERISHESHLVNTV